MVADGPRFEGRTAAVTGGGGFIGAAIARELATEGAKVVGLDVNPSVADRVREAGAAFAEADVTDRDALDAALEGVELVVHTAAFVHEWGEMEDFVEVNVRGTANVLDAAREAGAERVVHISSVVVYGYDDPSHQDEEAFHRTYGIPYIDTKGASDRIARGRGAVVIRPGDVYGPGSTQWVLRPLEMAKGRQLSVPGEGDGVMLPVFVDDLVEAVTLGLLKGKPERAYTAWDGEPVTFHEYFGRIARLANGPAPRKLPRPLLRGMGRAMEAYGRLRGRPPAFTARATTFVDRRGTVSTQRIRDELGWEPRVDLDEGIRRTEEWLRAEGLL
jgi:nucleoside-diphosphate-sugar epimerase